MSKKSRAIYYAIRRIAITTSVPFLLGAVSFQLTGSYAIYITFTARAGAYYGNECREGHTEPRKVLEKTDGDTLAVASSRPVQWTLAQFDDNPGCLRLPCLPNTTRSHYERHYATTYVRCVIPSFR